MTWASDSSISLIQLDSRRSLTSLSTNSAEEKADLLFWNRTLEAGGGGGGRGAASQKAMHNPSLKF